MNLFGGGFASYQACNKNPNRLLLNLQQVAVSVYLQEDCGSWIVDRGLLKRLKMHRFLSDNRSLSSHILNTPKSTK